MDVIFSSPLFGIALCILCFEAGLFVSRKTKSPLANPLLNPTILCILFLVVFRVDLDDFRKGGDIISMFLGPATAVLGLSMYSQLKILKRNLLPVCIGTLAGACVSMTSVLLMCRLFGLDEELAASLLPKSVTTPVAMEISAQAGGIVPVTVAAVVVTGIFGAAAAPLLIKLFRVKDPVEAGLAIGSCSHAAGTSRALELGEVEGAMSGIAIGFSGIFTVVLSLFF